MRALDRQSLDEILAAGGTITVDDEAESRPLLLDANGRPIVRDPEPEVEVELEEVAPCPKCGEVAERVVIEALGGYGRELCGCGHEFRRGRGLAPTGGV